MPPLGEPVSEMEERTSSFPGRDALPGFSVFRLPHLAGDAPGEGVKSRQRGTSPLWLGTSPNTIPSSVMEKDDSV